MSNTQTIAKFAAVAAGFGLVASSFVAALPAAAQTTTTTTSTTSTMSAAQVAALEAQIASLQAQLSAVTGGTTTAMSTTFTRDLTIGATGSDVTALQTWLIAKGYSIPAGATGYFGTQTQAALAAYQAANGISPAAGYFGPITRAQVNATAGTTTTGGTTTTTTGTLSGGEGSITNFKNVGASTSSLNAGQSLQVYGFNFTAQGSDLRVDRVYFDLYNSNNTGAIRPWSVFGTATLTDANGNTIATLDASNSNNWSQDGTDSVTGNQKYALQFNNLNQIVPMNSNVSYYLTLSTQGVISSANNGAIYTVSLASQGVRATDGAGLQEYSPTGTTATISISSNTTGSAVLSTGSDSPQTTTVQGSSNSQTSAVVLTTFTVQAKDADAYIYTLPTNVATTSATASSLVRDLKLYEGSSLIDTESFAAGAASTSLKFQNLNIKIPSGTTQTFSIQADVNQLNTGSNEGASIAVSVPATGWDIENNTSSPVSLTGSVTGNAITFRSTGASATVTAGSPQPSGQDTTAASFSFSVPVTAFGQTVYVGSTTSAFGATIHTATTTYAVTGVINSSATKDSASGAYVVNPGQTQTFTITVSATGAAGVGLNYATLDSIKYGLAGNATTATTFTFPSGSNNQTSAILLNAS